MKSNNFSLEMTIELKKKIKLEKLVNEKES